MKVHSKVKPPDIRMRLTKVFKLGNETARRNAVFQVIIADGCLFYGNDALRSRGGCCICLLMASGLIAKRFSIWVADASEGEITQTTFSKRLKLAVFYHPSPLGLQFASCGQSNMDDRRGGHEKTTTEDKDVLIFAVRYFSRKYLDKTYGQEVCWTRSPPDWPHHLGAWKNPTSKPKDNTAKLWEKYDYLRSKVPKHKLNQEELEAFEDFKPGKMENVKSFMLYKMFTDIFNKIKSHVSDMQEHHRILVEKDCKSLFSSTASTSKGSIAADTSVPANSRKRKLSNTCTDSSEHTISSNHTEASAATNGLSSIVTSPIGIMYPLPGSHGEPSRAVSPCGIQHTLSVDSGTCSQESYIDETVNGLEQLFQLQDNLIWLEFQNCQKNNFDPKIVINSDDFLTHLDDDFLEYFDEDT